MYKKAYKILKNNSIFIQPLLVWQIAFTAVLFFCSSRNQLLIPRITLFISIILLLIACLSGWFYINKHAVLSYNETDLPDEITTKTVQNFKKFFEGIGSDFIRTFLASILCIGFYSIVTYGLYKFCLSNYGVPTFVNDMFEIIQTSTKEQIIQYFNNINDSDKLIFSKWVLTLNTGISVLNFLAILYYAVMSFEKKNFLLSFFKALKFFIFNIFEAIGIMIFVFIIYLLINMISVFFYSNAFLFALLIIIITLYFNYYVLLVFCFYNDKTNAEKDNSNNRTECVGENKSGSTTCEKP